MQHQQSQHYLTAITSLPKRKKFAVFDIESKHEDTQEAGFTTPFLVGFYDPLGLGYQSWRTEPHLKKREWRERYWAPGGCIDKLMNYLLTPRFKGYQIYSHNGGSFDMLFLLAWIRAHEDEFGFSIVPVQSSIQILEVWRRPRNPEEGIREKWTFIDSMKLLPMGLEKACKTFGLPGKVKQDLNVHEDHPSWEIYLKQDCIALVTVLERVTDMILAMGGEVGVTTPATAMKLYRREFLGRGEGNPAKIPRHAHYMNCADIKTCKGCAHEWVRDAYYGGRTEVFRMQGENLHYYDINSSYVAAMRETMPGGDRMVEKRYRPELHEKYVGFVQCTVTIPEDCEIPPLPYRHSKTGKLVFPVGTFSGTWSVEELRLLEDPSVKGVITDVVQAMWYRRKPLFVGYVDKMWSLRDERLPTFDEGMSALAKLMGNSLYGKFGMRQDRTQVVIARKNRPEGSCILCVKDAEDEGQFCKDCLGSKPASDDDCSDVYYQNKFVDTAYIIPQIAAHITALARVRLWRFMRQAIDAGGRIYYSDTDSVITDIEMPSSKELGAFKDEYPGIRLRGTFLQPKVYMLENLDWKEPDKKWEKPEKVTMKGFSAKERTREGLTNLLGGQTLGWKRLEKVRTLARSSFRRGPEMVHVTKSFRSSYDKRVVQADGVSTKPIVLNEAAVNEDAPVSEPAVSIPPVSMVRLKKGAKVKQAS